MNHCIRNHLVAILPWGLILAAYPAIACAGDVLHVPMSWCAVRGSPAVEDPDVPRRPPPNDMQIDTDTDAILWRRHERATDGEIGVRTGGTWLPQAQISFRSAINNTWGSDLSFEIIDDQDTSNVPPPANQPLKEGDVLIERSRTDELFNMIGACERSWEDKDPMMMSQVYGVTAINIRLFHNTDNTYADVAGVAFSPAVGFPGPNPMRPRIIVVDNSFLFPGADDNIDLGPMGRDFSSEPDDPLDILVAHELGHALDLPHRRPVGGDAPLMFEVLVDADQNGEFDNQDLSADEIATARAAAMRVNGLEADPPGIFLPGPIVSFQRVDDLFEQDARHHDIFTSKIVLDTDNRRISFEQELAGLLPKQGDNQIHWTLVDSDNKKSTGADPKILREQTGVTTSFEGTDLAIAVEVSRDQDELTVNDRVWVFDENGEGFRLSPDAHKSGVALMLAHLLYFPGTEPDPSSDGIPVNHIVSTQIDDDMLINPFAEDQLFNIQMLVTGQDGEPLDVLDDTEFGVASILQRPSFPHAYALDDQRNRIEGIVAAGDSIAIEVEGLVPEAPFHVLLSGVELISEGVTNVSGNAFLDLRIPDDVAPGLHLVTIGTENTALTADFTVTVVPEPSTTTLLWLSGLFARRKSRKRP